MKKEFRAKNELKNYFNDFIRQYVCSNVNFNLNEKDNTIFPTRVQQNNSPKSRR